MEGTEQYVKERLDHLEIVVGVHHETGQAAWLDAQDPDRRQPGECGNGDSRDGTHMSARV